MSQYMVSNFGGGAGPVLSLTSNAGGAVPPTAGNINVDGDAVLITGTGNPGTSTITFSIVDGLDGQLIIGGNGAGAQWADLTSTGGTIVVTPGVNTLNIEVDGSIADVYTTDAGNAIPAVGVLNILGINGITTTGAGNTVTIDGAAASEISITGNTGGALLGDAFIFSGGTTGLSFGGAVATQTLTFAGITANGGAVNLGTDNAANAITIGTGTVARNINIGLSAAAHVISIGTNNGASSLGLNAGTGDMTLISGDAITLDASGVLELNSTGGAISVGNDANAFAINIGTGGAARTITVGNTTGATDLDLRYGTGDFTLASATGTVMSALDTGEITYPLQPAFMGYLATSDANATGAGTVYTLGTVTALTEVYDRNGDFTTTGVFTAPVDGVYSLWGKVTLSNCTIQTSANLFLTTTNRVYQHNFNRPASSTTGYVSLSVLADMDNGDTYTLLMSGGGEAADTETVAGGAVVFNAMGGYLAC